MLTLTLASVVTAGSVDVGGPAGDFAQSLLLGAAIGVGGGVGAGGAALGHRLGLWRESPAAAILAVVAAEYFASEEIGGVGLPGGVRDGPRRRQHGPAAPAAATAEHFAVLEGFTAQAAEVAILAVFVTLG